MRTRFHVVIVCLSGSVLVGCNDYDHITDDGSAQLVRPDDQSKVTTTDRPEQKADACADYAGLTALLAEKTIACTGTIGPNSFAIDDQGQLKNNFDSCTAGDASARASNFESVTKLVRLQAFRSALPRFQECLVDRYTRWTELFKRTELKSCPAWKKLAVFGEGNAATSKQLGKMQLKFPYVPASPKNVRLPSPGAITQQSARLVPTDLQPSPDERFADIHVPSKSSILYEISYSQPEPNCDDPAVCAAQCAAFLPGFVVSAAGNQLVADPASWYRDRTTTTCSAVPSDDPWCPPNFVHQMSLYSTSSGPVPPGDLYGHPNRGNMGEHCDRWFPGVGNDPGFNYETDLGLECADDAQTICLSRCGD